MSEIISLWKPSAPLYEIKRRANLLRVIRQYFEAEQVTEVETPFLSASATVDPHIESFETAFVSSDGKTKHCYLHTSPEFPMKRLLAAGSGDIYSLGKVFRNGEAGSRHNPEFTMLEWYRLGFSCHRLMDDITNLLKSVFLHQNKMYEESQRITYKALFQEKFNVDPHAVDLQALRQLVNSNIDRHLSNLNRNDCLDLLFSHCIEPTLGSVEDNNFKGIFVYDYPKGMAALSRMIDNGDGQVVAGRFELFIGGVEMANGYDELTDEKEQLSRFRHDQATREKSGKPVPAFDHALIDALNNGLPRCAGVALGVDRLHMLLAGISDIRKTLAFDFFRA